MRIIYLDEIRGNEVAGCNIMDLHGRVLITKGARVRLSYLDRLLEVGITSLYIEDEISEGIKLEGILCEETKQMSKAIVEGEMQRFFKRKEIDPEVIKKVASTIINDILNGNAQLINLKDIRLKDEYIFSHSVNVCTLAVFLCIKIGYEHSKVLSVGTGALIHDIGKILIPSEILNKTTPLTKDEDEMIKKHPIFGYEALKDDVTVNPITKMVVYMHHEKSDGSGYPNGLTSDKIHESAKLTSICDVFDSYTSDKPYRKAHPISDVIEYLHSVAGIYYDKTLVEEFLKYVPMFPPGTIVLLNNGVVGIVLKNSTKSFWRPVVRLLYNTKNKVKYGSNIEVDLMQNLTLKIEREVKYNP